MKPPYKLISICIATVVLSLPAAATTGRDAITPEQIAAAISTAGVAITGKQVTLLTEVFARTRAPALEVKSMDPIDSHRMKVRLECANVEECVSFYVIAYRDVEGAAQPYPARPVQAPGSNATAISRTERSTFDLRAGSSATLLLEGDHMSIQLPVICLENGVIGKTIRVASIDHRQTYTARIFDGRLLRGKL